MTGIFRSGDLVFGQVCPKCLAYEVVYNGNYFCMHCDWAMSRDIPRIIKAYLIQRRAEAVLDGDPEEVRRIDFHLIKYADEVKV